MRARSNAIRVGLAATLLAGRPRRRPRRRLSGSPSGRNGFLPSNGRNRRGHVLVPQLDSPSGDHCHFSVGLGAYCLYRLRLQTTRCTPAVAFYSLRRDRNRLAVASLHFCWSSLRCPVPAARGATHHTRARPDGEGDGLAVALELWLPEIRGRVFVHFPAHVEDKDLKPGQPRVITADHEMVVPVGKVIEFDVVSQDVIHSFSVPSFGIKIDAIPGRWTRPLARADHDEGMFYGQRRICGIDHAFMPINVLGQSQAGL